MAGMVNLVIAFCTDEVESARVAMAEPELEALAAAKSLEAGKRRLRDADMIQNVRGERGGWDGGDGGGLIERSYEPVWTRIRDAALPTTHTRHTPDPHNIWPMPFAPWKRTIDYREKNSLSTVHHRPSS